MGDEHHANDDKRTESKGRIDNGAVPIGDAPKVATPEDYPKTAKDDSVEAPGETRTFHSETGNPEPRQGAGDGGPAPSVNEGRLGPGADPVEGKR
jgi:hypothetical protein